MKSFLNKIIILFILIFVVAQPELVLAVVVISNADEAWSSDIAIIPNEVIDASDVLMDSLEGALILRADEVWDYEFKAIPDDFINPVAVSFIVSSEALVLRADETWGYGLNSVEVGDGSSILVKNPVLFVPGLLGTEISKDGSLLWANTKMALPGNSDSFMDPLSFEADLLPSDEALLLGKVIHKLDFYNITLYDYTQGLIDEFATQGYVENVDFFTFPYDWRYGVSGAYPKGQEICAEDKTNATLLRDRINELAKNSPTGKVDVVAHSLGGLVTKKYIIDNADTKIGKLVFVGVPNLGSPDAAQTLLSGSDFKIFGLNPEEMRKISYNMPAAYDLLPGQPYYDKIGSYLGLLSQASDLSTMDYRLLNHEDAQLYLRSHLNNTGLAAGAALHAGNNFDNYDVRGRVDAAYNIAGCKSGTLSYASGNSAGLPKTVQPYNRTSGDDTVPFESADSIMIDDNKRFYMPLAEHGKMPSQDGVRQMIAGIIADGAVPTKIIAHSTLENDPSLCQIKGDIIEIHSPLDIFVTQTDGGKSLRLGLDETGNIIREIPGASFDSIDGHKYLYLPQGDGQEYSIDIRGTGRGFFTLVDKKIEGEDVRSAKVFNDIPVTPDFNGRLEILGNAARIVPNTGIAINPTSEILGSATLDILAPQTISEVAGLEGAPNYYRGAVTVGLSTRDFAQEGATPAGAFSISYRLDDDATSTIPGATTTVEIDGEGSHRLIFFAADKLGNKEEPKTVDFVIDKTPPEFGFNFDQTKKDLVFFATDNISGSNDVKIFDAAGVVTASDLAGNTAKLSFNEKNRIRSLRAQLSGLAYNDKAINMTGNQLAFAWFYGYAPGVPATLSGMQSLPAVPAVLPKTGPLSFLLQQSKLKGRFICRGALR